MSHAAPRLNNQLFQEHWNSPIAKRSMSEAQVSCLLVEEVMPPAYLWDRITQKLDNQANAQALPPASHPLSRTNAIILMLVAATAAITLTLYWLI
jgi:hypothetical protein